MKTSLVFAAILALCAPLASHADTYAAATVGASTAAEKFDIGPMLVERHGSRGSPMIFIAGLSGGPYVWDDAVREFGKDHVLYLVTLPGFDGRPAASGDLVAGSDQWIGELIASRKLVRPVLVGHSLGGIFSIAYAEKHADQIGGVVAIDGLPVFPGTENMTLEQRTAIAATMKQRMAGITRAAFEAQQKTYMRGPGGASDPVTADALAARNARSDPAAVTDYMTQVLALDLRGGLPAIKVPVLVIAPFNEADMKAAGMPMTAATKTAYYTGLMAGTPKLTVVPVSPSRHFAMFDQPQQVTDAIRAYLKTL
ncbi:MAG: alpha/beta hydrolase [Pseudomonadota bacterium]|nr:alpha/beta hydrolase [Pseudomonadota bacterium]